MASDKKGERMEVDPIESQHEAELLAEFERRRRARTLTLPTDDVQVGVFISRFCSRKVLHSDIKIF